MKNGSSVLAPVSEMPFSGMQMMVSVKNRMLTIEFDRQISWLQFNRMDAKRFVQGLAAYVAMMEAD